jgi:glycine/D-amino acid oxidase-like deaminating enzyme
VEVRFNTPVATVRHAGARVQGVTLAGGEIIDAGAVINAAGPWCNDLLADLQLDIPWHLTPTRIQIAYLDRPAEVPGHIPVTVDMAAGIYFRQQNRGQQIVLGSVLEEDERERVADPDNFNLFPDDDFLQAKLHALHHRIPTLPYRGKVRGYCGLYTTNEEDVHPLVGETELAGLYLANGFSGHGFKLAPAIGAMVARMLYGGGVDFDTVVNPNFFSIDRTPIQLGTRSVLA